MDNIYLMDLFTEGIIDGLIGHQYLGGDDLTIVGSMTVDVSVVAPKRVGITSATGRLDEEYIEQIKVVN